MTTRHHPTLRIEIVDMLQTAGRAYVLGRQLDAGYFSLSEAATLGGASIAPWLDVPRRMDSSAAEAGQVFAFCLCSCEDLPRFGAGDIVELSP